MLHPDNPGGPVAITVLCEIAGHPNPDEEALLRRVQRMSAGDAVAYIKAVQPERDGPRRGRKPPSAAERMETFLDTTRTGAKLWREAIAEGLNVPDSRVRTDMRAAIRTITVKLEEIDAHLERMTQ